MVNGQADRLGNWPVEFLRSVSKSLIGLNSRARQARATSGIGIAVGLVFSLFNLLTPGMAPLGLTELAAVVFMLLPAALICSHPRGVGVAEGLITAATVTILGALIHFGGLQGTGLFWAYLAPFLAFFLKGQQRGWRYSLTFLAGVAVYLVLVHDHLTLAYRYTVEVKTQFLMSLVFYTVIAAAFNRLRDHYEKELQQNLEDLTAAQMTSELAFGEAELALAQARASHERVEQILWSANLGTWEFDVQTREVVFNERCAEMLGRTLAEIGGASLRYWLALEHPGDAAQMREAMQRCIDGDSTTYAHEGRMLHKNGEWIWMLDRGRVAERDADGKPLRFMGTRQDITALKSADERQLLAVLEASPDAMLLVAADGGIRFANSVAHSMFGYSPEELARMNVDALVPPGRQQGHAAQRDLFVSNAVARPMTANRRISCAHRDGHEFPVEVGLSPFTLHGERMVIAAIADITERVANQKQLMENEVKLRKAQEMAGFGSYMTDLKTGQWESSAQLDAIFGLTPDFVYDIANWNLVVDEEFRRPSLEHYRDVAAGRCDFRMDYRITRPCDGQKRWVAANGELERDAQGNALRLIGTIQDITERKQAEARLMELNESLETRVQERTNELGLALERAEVAKRSRGDFLSNMSHEIRTPMNAVMGMVYLALQSNPSAQQRDYLEKIQTAGSHLVGLISDILDFSKIDAGKLALEVGDFDLHRVLSNVLQLTEGRAREKGLQLSQQIAPEVPQNLRGDSLRLGQIIINYVNNAIKFTEHGVVTLRVSQREVDASGARLLRFEVQDTGIGVTDAQRQRLFQSFEQADNSISRKYGGTGLGLAICKQLAQLMGGEVGLDSVPGAGSTFWFTARLGDASEAFATLAAAEASQHSGDELRGTHMLVVDDSAFNLEVAKGMLEALGVHVMLANDGAQAVQLVQEGRFDCVLMDMRMPVMDGLQATRLIRGNAETSRLPVVGLTANASSEDHALCIEAGMLAVVTKPINPPLLFATLAKVLAGTRDVASALPASDGPACAGPEATGPTPLWDAQALTRTMGNFPAIHKRLLAHFRLDSESYREQIALAVDQSRFADAAEVAHKFKSSARTVGAMRLGDLCEFLEKAGLSGDHHVCRTLNARLPQELQDVSIFLGPAET